MKAFDLYNPLSLNLKISKTKIASYPFVIKHMKRYETISPLREFELGKEI
jgi:hypothetical protein